MKYDKAKKSDLVDDAKTVSDDIPPFELPQRPERQDGL
jgi:hypothetical protein